MSVTTKKNGVLICFCNKLEFFIKTEGYVLCILIRNLENI
jgi:hypothetical protein